MCWLRSSILLRRDFFSRILRQRTLLSAVQPRLLAGKYCTAGWLKNSAKDCYNEIENYVDGHGKGLTRKCLRYACGLPAVPPDANLHEKPSEDPIDAALMQMRIHSDALIPYLLDNEHEYMTEALCRLTTCLPGANPTERKSYFHLLINHGMWKASAKPSGNSSQTYIPMIKTLHGILFVFPTEGPGDSLQLDEELAAHDLQHFMNNPNRQCNVDVLAQSFEALKHSLMIPGAKSRSAKYAYEEAERKVKK